MSALVAVVVVVDMRKVMSPSHQELQFRSSLVLAARAVPETRRMGMERTAGARLLDPPSRAQVAAAVKARHQTIKGSAAAAVLVWVATSNRQGVKDRPERSSVQLASGASVGLERQAADLAEGHQVASRQLDNRPAAVAVAAAQTTAEHLALREWS